MSIVEKFPGIKRVATVCGYSMGMTQKHLVDKWLTTLDPILGADGLYDNDLEALSNWCLSLTDDEVDLLIEGTDEERELIADKAPNPEHVGIFDDLFEE